MTTCEKYVIVVGDKEIEIDESVVKILNHYARTEMNLEQLAEHLGLDSWMEAYEFVKKVPAWILWVHQHCGNVRWRSVSKLTRSRL